MDTLFDFIFSFTYTMGLTWYLFVLIKTAFLLAITFGVIYFIDAIQLIKTDDTFDFKTKTQLVRLNSCIVTLLFVNLYWFFFIKFNGLIRFNWNQFMLDNSNIYFSILPLLLSTFFVLYLYNNAIKNLKL